MTMIPQTADDEDSNIMSIINALDNFYWLWYFIFQLKKKHKE